MIMGKRPIQNDEGLYTYGYIIPRYCGYCGSMLPRGKKMLEDIFKVYDLNIKLADAKRLVLKSEYSAACRECFVVLENTIKNESGIQDLHGSELISKAFSMKIDKSTGIVQQAPLIAINDLSNESKINEQDGIMHMLMGFFRGPRNIYQHNEVRMGFDACFPIMIETSFFLDIIIGKHSLLSKPHWIKSKVDFSEIYHKMPRIRDRIAFMFDFYRLKLLNAILYRKNKIKN